MRFESFLCIAAVSLIAATPPPVNVEKPPAAAPAIPETIAYLAAVEKAEAGKGTVEEVFVAARGVREALLRHDDEGNNFIESLTDAQYAALENELRGMILNREEVLIVRPDPSFLKSLAQKAGRPVDHDFLRNYTATFPDGVWASYIEQQTDFSGCTDFGGGELVKRYAGWTEFRRAHPDSYVSEVSARIEDIEEHLDSTCGCRKRDDVLRELEQFAETFPDAEVTKKTVKRRIREIRAGSSDMRYECNSG